MPNFLKVKQLCLKLFFYAEVKNHGEDFGIIYFRKIHRLFMQFFFSTVFFSFIDNFLPHGGMGTFDFFL